MLAPGSKEIEELNELAAATTAEITQAMLTQRLELEEKRRSVLMLQKALVIYL
jgi:DNA-binding HxlR family transcriptional regulator